MTTKAVIFPVRLLIQTRVGTSWEVLAPTAAPESLPETGLTVLDLYRVVQSLKGHTPSLEAILLHEDDREVVESLTARQLGSGALPFGGVNLFIWDGTPEQLIRLGFSEAPGPGEGVLRYAGDPLGEPS